MSKAFTREDDDAGFAPPSSTSIALPTGPLRLTATGARLLLHRAHEQNSEPLRAAMARTKILATVVAPARAALGVTVVVRDEHAATLRYRLVSPEEHTLLGEGCSIASPLGRALLGSSVGDLCEVVVPRSREATELEVVALEGEN